MEQTELKNSAYKYDSNGYKSTLEPKVNNYRDYSTNAQTINHQNFYDSNSITNASFKKNKVLKYFNGGGRQIFEQLCNKLRKYENLKSLYSSNETIKNLQSNTSNSNGKYSTVKPREDSKTKCSVNERIMKKYQKEITMIAKKKREYIMAQAKNLKKGNFNNLAIKTSHLNGNSNNVNTTASTILMSMAGNGNNLSITEYPGMNESLASLNQDFIKYKIGDYPPSTTHKNKSNGGRNSTKKFLRDTHTEIRKKHNCSVDKRKAYEYKKSTGSRKRSEEGNKKKRNSNHGDSGVTRSSLSNSNFPKIDPNIFLVNSKASKKNLKKNQKKEKWVKRNIIAQNRFGRQQLVDSDLNYAH